jgi:ABC-type multidrug transport system ATPase subunit
MNISLHNISKKFNENWVFRDVSIEIKSKEKLAILGANGSGKSTLMQIIAGYVSQTSGTITYELSKEIHRDEMYKYLSVVAPSTELIEEFTLGEMVTFYIQLKPLFNGLKANDILDICYLNDAKNKSILHYSSGMKQRLKLALAVLSDVPLLLIDEPTSNLDNKGIQWYKNLITEHAVNKTIIVCSNQMNDEYFFCSKQLNIDDYKK